MPYSLALFDHLSVDAMQYIYSNWYPIPPTTLAKPS